MGKGTECYRISDLGYRYGARAVLEGLSTVLARGRFYGLLGPNGCGKTTLIDLMARLKRPAAGTIRLAGRDLSGIRRRRLAREVALVPQDFSVNFPFTARETVLMGRYPHMARFSPPAAEDLEAVEDVLDRTDTRHLADRPMTTLSGGERQRVVFARALVQGAPVLLLDEATSNLDIRHALQLLGLTAELVARRSYTVLAVFQDINLAAMFCDELLLMTGGRVVRQGPVGAVLTPETIAEAYGVRCRVRYDAAVEAFQVGFLR
jgi:iron complex transport system ATP-binding protein